MPHRMAKVYSEIYNHPQFESHVPASMKFAIRIAEGGWSYCTRANNKWIRSIWRYLYVPDAPPPEPDEDFLGKFTSVVVDESPAQTEEQCILAKK